MMVLLSALVLVTLVAIATQYRMWRRQSSIEIAASKACTEAHTLVPGGGYVLALHRAGGQPYVISNLSSSARMDEIGGG
eukprot:3324523-Pleurochrysis_carterae.AAC.1